MVLVIFRSPKTLGVFPGGSPCWVSGYQAIRWAGNLTFGGMYLVWREYDSDVPWVCCDGFEGPFWGRRHFLRSVVMAQNQWFPPQKKMVGIVEKYSMIMSSLYGDSFALI